MGERRIDKVQDEPEIPCTRKYGCTQRMMEMCPKEVSLQALPCAKLNAIGMSKYIILVTDLAH